MLNLLLWALLGGTLAFEGLVLVGVAVVWEVVFVLFCWRGFGVAWRTRVLPKVLWLLCSWFTSPGCVCEGSFPENHKAKRTKVWNTPRCMLSLDSYVFGCVFILWLMNKINS